MSIYRNSNLAILLSGGVGSRIQTDMPKQYVRVSGFMMVTYALQTLIESDCIDGVYVVADESYRDEIVGDIADLFGDKGQEGKSDSCVKDDKIQKIRGFVDPGENRQLSILNALEKIREDIGKGDLVYDVVNDVDVDKNNKDKHINSSDVTVLVQDAARPMLSKKMIAQCYEALPGHDGVMPVLPMKDTVYMSRDGKSVSQLLDRSQVFAGQAPELFLYELTVHRSRRFLQVWI